MEKGRAPCCDKSKVIRGAWSPEEDLILTNFIQKHGHTNWRSLPMRAGLLRCGKSCRLRWLNYLRPGLKRGDFTKEEEEAMIKLHCDLGNQWSKIASHFPGRTDNEIKNVLKKTLKKRLDRKKGDHVSHHKDETNGPSKQALVTSSQSSSRNSILYPNKKEDNGDEIEEQENNEPMEYLNLLNSPSVEDYCLDSSGLNGCYHTQAEDSNILINNSYQGNHEMHPNPDQDTGNFPLGINLGYLELLFRDDPVEVQQSQEKDFGISQSNSLEENERNDKLAEWMKALENELQGTVGRKDQP